MSNLNTWSAVSQSSIKSVNNKAYHELELLNLVKILIVRIYDQRRRAHGSDGVSCPRCPNNTGGSMEGKRGCPFFTTTALKNTRAIRDSVSKQFAILGPVYMQASYPVDRVTRFAG